MRPFIPYSVFSIFLAVMASAMMFPPEGSALPKSEPPAALLERVVREFFTPRESAEVVVESRTAGEMLQGRFTRLRLDASDTSVKGMPIQSAALELRDFVIDVPLLRTTGKIRVFSAAAINYKVEVSQQSLNWLISEKKKLSKDRPPRLELGDGHVILDGYLRMGLFDSSFRLKGRLESHALKDIHFIPDSVSVGWLKLPGFVMDTAADRLNPVLTIRKLMELERCNMQIREIVVAPGLLTVSG